MHLVVQLHCRPGRPLIGRVLNQGHCFDVASADQDHNGIVLDHDGEGRAPTSRMDAPLVAWQH